MRDFGPKDAKDFKRMLDAFILRYGEGDVRLGMEDPVHVSIVWNAEGYGPHIGAIVVDQLWGIGGDETLQRAYEILEQEMMDDPQFADHIKDLQEEYGDDWNEIFTETFDGRLWEMTPEEFVWATEDKIGDKYTDVTQFIDIEDDEEEED
jgi:hypothetical protein